MNSTNNRRYFVGLDLGQASQFTALAVIERPVVSPDDPLERLRPAHTLRHLQRFALGTPYPEIVKTVRDLIRKPPMPGCLLCADVTGVGQAVCALVADGLRHQVTCDFLAVTIVASEASASSIPRLELVGTLQVLFQTHRLLIPSTLPDADLLVKELTNFRIKPVTNPDDPLAAWRNGPHDDLVLAVALAAWLCEQTLPPLYPVPEPRPIRYVLW